MSATPGKPPRPCCATSATRWQSRRKPPADTARSAPAKRGQSPHLPRRSQDSTFEARPRRPGSPRPRQAAAMPSIYAPVSAQRSGTTVRHWAGPRQWPRPPAAESARAPQRHRRGLGRWRDHRVHRLQAWRPPQQLGVQKTPPRSARHKAGGLRPSEWYSPTAAHIPPARPKQLRTIRYACLAPCLVEILEPTANNLGLECPSAPC
mmetsp:Transcript_158427/g.508190  ORF Transcript_158427/g.508190 Transcript_158427/m.508190 type:complete len:206 (-) Transcript_158427:35-652(-)